MQPHPSYAAAAASSAAAAGAFGGRMRGSAAGRRWGGGDRLELYQWLNDVCNDDRGAMMQ